jgi:hypothetical protein
MVLKRFEIGISSMFGVTGAGGRYSEDLVTQISDFVDHKEIL